MRTRAVLAFSIAFVLLTAAFSSAANPEKRPAPLICNSGSLPTGGDGTQDVHVVGPGTCFVNAGTYYYHNINIFGGGTLQFQDNGNTDLWVANILVENNSAMLAGTPSAPYGVNGVLTIHLWGPAQSGGTGHGDGGVGISCLSDGNNECGVPASIWTSNCPGNDCSQPFPLNPTSCVSSQLPGNVTDCFYPYMPLEYDDGGKLPGYFGYKVLGVSYGGTLQLYGKKGATYSQLTPAQSGTSWARLAQTVTTGATSLTLDRTVDWAANDQIVLTTTDFLPADSEVFTIQSASTNHGATTLTLTTKVQYTHSGQTYDIGAQGVPNNIGPTQDPKVICSSGQTRCVETRAAVGLLTRSIRIVSAGDTYNAAFPGYSSQCEQSNNCYYFGGHTVFREGFQAVQIQGVEFYQMGQGGRIMHYPVHFHMARQTPANTYVADCSVVDSMNRWYTIHATQGVTLARNVGFLSIGHGYYLEDGSETGNKLYANLGVLARAGIQNPQNPRYVPGILAAAHQNDNADEIPFHTDYDHPTVFWMMNGYNDFEYNFAAGAGTCGMCYWLLPSTNSGKSRYEYWDSYAGEQQYRVAGGIDDPTQAGIAPLYKFVGNACSTAQNSFSTIGDSTPCSLAPGGNGDIVPVINPLAPPFPGNPAADKFSPPADAYYPKVVQSGFHQGTACPESGSCANVTPCSYQSNMDTAPANCLITDIDHYTTSFNWAQFNYSAIWLRSQWYLFTNSAVTDVIGSGLTFVSGGGYTGSDHIPGYWALAHKDVFVGQTQPTNPLTSPAGPFNPNSKLTCDSGTPAAVCSSIAQGVAIPLDNFDVNQRLLSFYDGPAYQANNAYLDITKTVLSGCTQGNGAAGNCTGWMFWRTLGVPLDPAAPSGSQCYMPNAAMGWKQPNGFYYPPAFHSDKLYFNNVDIRHFVIEPLFIPGTFQTDTPRAEARYCVYTSSNMFTNFTDIDRQTELSDDDGSLTGLLGPLVDPQNKTYDPSISVNKDPFFNAPVETAECASDIPQLMRQGADCPYAITDPRYDDLCATAKTSPYEYTTTVVYPQCGTTGNCLTSNNQIYWGAACQDQTCYGVPLYREDLNPDEKAASPIRMMADSTYQRSNLTANHGLYYINTTVPQSEQYKYDSPSIFLAGQTYYVFPLFAQPDTSITFQLYVGPDFDASTLTATRVDQLNNPPTFTAAGAYPCPSGGCYDQSTGMLTVPLDMSLFSDFQANFDAERANECAPATFCTWNSTINKCGCNSSETLVPQLECQYACANWSTKDVDCPSGGCYGFAFTLPTDFESSPKVVPPPNVGCYPKNKDWNVRFSNPTQNPGSCLYAGTLPVGVFCSSKETPKANDLGMKY